MTTGSTKPEQCPTCGTLCNITWSGIDLVENSGDETLATKVYTPDGGAEELLASQSSELSKLREENERLWKLQMDEGVQVWVERGKKAEHSLTEKEAEIKRLKLECAHDNAENIALRESNRELVEALTYARKRVFNLLRNVKWYATGCAATSQQQDDHANQSEAIKIIDAALSKVTPQE